ncbi:MAG: ABC transporter permease [Rhodobacterales bacterium]|nr:MAG: ABC transporter permease [Rhodobacterales bacterium]
MRSIFFDLWNGALDRFGRALQFLWGGWAGLAALCLLGAVWQAGYERYGDFILPPPLNVVLRAFYIVTSAESWAIAADTALRATQAFLLSAVVGMVLGIWAGYSHAVLRLVRPFLTIMLGVPPVAWIVLAMIWFGPADGTVIVTVLVAATPIMLAGTAEGILTRDRGLDEMAEVFGAGPLRRFATLGLRQMSAHVFPALVLALATGFKVAVMAELLANAGGIGGALADARANFDIEEALAWVTVSVAILIVVEYGAVQPLRGELERWKRAAQPWGVKR